MMLILLLIVASSLTVSSKYTIFHASDFRGDFNPFILPNKEEVGGLARIFEILRQPSDRIFIYTGSFIHRPYSPNKQRLKVERDILDLMGLDTLVLGNNEFKLVPDNFAWFLEKAGCPIVSTNILIPKTQLEVTIKEKLVILSYTNKYVENPGTIPYPTKDIITAINERTQHYITLQNFIFIAAGCSGIKDAIRIAKETNHIHIVISGCSEKQKNQSKFHKETETVTYPLEVKNKHGKTVRIAHISGTTKLMGQLRITLDGLGNLQDCTGARIYVNSTKSDNKHLKNLLKELDSLEIGKTAVYLNGKCEKRECNLGNLITDAFIQYKSDMYDGEYWTDTPIALMPADNIKSSINASATKGVIYAAHLVYVLPEPKKLVTVKILGSDLHKVLVSALDNKKQHTGKFLQVSGLHIRFDRRKRLGKRMIALMCRCSHCRIPGASDIKMKRKYRIITTEDLAAGDHGHYTFGNLSTIMTKENITDLEAVHMYIKQMRYINTKIEERIRIVKKQSSAESFKISKCSVVIITIITYLVFV